MRRLVYLLAVLFVLPISAEAACTADQVQASKAVVSSLQGLGSREDTGVSVYYTLSFPWYEQVYHSQLGLITSAANAEACLHSSTPAVYFEYGGERVAQATPMGGIKVVKSKP